MASIKRIPATKQNNRHLVLVVYRIPLCARKLSWLFGDLLCHCHLNLVVLIVVSSMSMHHAEASELCRFKDSWWQCLWSDSTWCSQCWMHVDPAQPTPICSTTDALHAPARNSRSVEQYARCCSAFELQSPTASTCTKSDDPAGELRSLVHRSATANRWNIVRTCVIASFHPEIDDSTPCFQVFVRMLNIWSH